MIRFIHTADIHFGVENYGKIDAATGIHSRLLDFKRALDFCIDVALEKKIDFFLFCGDAYKTTNPSPTQQKLLMQCFLRLQKAAIPVVIIVGNHDNPLSFGKATSLDIFGDLPIDGFHVISKPALLLLQTKNGPVQIVGMPWPSRHTIKLKEGHVATDNEQITSYLAKTVAQLIHSFAQQLDPHIPAVFGGHLTVSSGVFSGSEKRAVYGSDPVILPSQLAIAPFDYIALGHLHRYQNLNEGGHPAVVYSGSIERVDFGERKEDKGFCLVTIESKQRTYHEFIKTPMRPFIQIDVRLNLGRSQTEQIMQALANYDLTNAVVKIVYYLASGQKDQVDLDAITRACQSALYIAGIIPINQVEVREKRAVVKSGMDLQAALSLYFSHRISDANKQQELLHKALLLHQKVDDSQLE